MIRGLLIKIGKYQDEKAFNELYDITYSAVKSIVAPMIKDKSLIDDVIVSVYEKIWKSAGSYSPLFKGEQWIGKIAKNTAIDFIRKETKTYMKVTALDEDKNYYLNTDTYNFDDDIFSSLTEIEKKVMQLKITGYKQKEIAEILNMNLGRVKYLLKIARNKLIKKL